MRIICLHILLIIISTFVGVAQQSIAVARVPLSHYFQPDEYGGGIQNWSFAQDTSGILYVANNLGLLEFDGGTWRRFDVPNTTKIRSVYVDGRNRIFVGGQGQIGFFARSRHGFDFVSLLERLPEDDRTIDEVWKIIDLDGKIYFNTSNKLLVLDGETFTSVKLPHQIVRAFKVNDRLIVQFTNEGLYEYAYSNFLPIEGTATLNEELFAILDDPQGFLCFSGPGKIYQYQGTRLREVRLELNGLASSAINTAVRLETGDIAIGTQNSGLLVLDTQLRLKQHLSKRKGLQNRTIHALYEDDFHNLWVGLNNGINYVELNYPISLMNDEVGLEGTGYAAALHDNKVYVGTNNGLFVQQADGHNPSDQRLHLIPSSAGQVYSLSRIEDDLLLSHHRGAFQVKGHELERIHNLGTWKFLPTPHPDVSIGGDYQGICVFKRNSNGQWRMSHRLQRPKETSRVLEFEDDSTLWMTHGYKGAYRINLSSDFDKTKSVDFYGEGDGFPSNILISVYKLAENLIFTGERGIYNFEESSETFAPNTFLEILIGTEHTSKIVPAPNGDIFFLSDRSLGYLKLTSFGNYEKEYNVFRRVNKFLSDDLENISVLDDRNVLIGSKEGFVHFDPGHSFHIKDEFDVVLRQVEIVIGEDSLIDINGEFMDGLQIGRNHSMKFHFATPYFDGFEDLTYAHRLTGFDEHWSSWSDELVKEYTNLPAGDYSFEVKALNSYAKESRVLKMNFEIQPKWYESNLAYMAYALGAVLIFGFISFLQDKKYKKEKERLHQSREAAIKSKDAQLSQVSRESKAQIESLRDEKLRSEIDHKNNELASVTMHLLNKNEFVTDIKKRIESIMNDNGKGSDELKKIVKNIDRNLHEDQSWDQFAFHFDQVHGDFLKNLSKDDIKLTPQETKLAAYLRMNMSSKEIANLMNISVRGVELGRYRLRKKLKLTRDQNLIDYLLQV